jgi:hypothetical protein
MTSNEEDPAPAETITDSETDVTPKRERSTVTFMGNNYDLTAVVAVTVGGVVLLSCFTCNMGWYCLPFIPIILGIITLVSAQDSVDPERTKLLSWISIGSGAAIIILAALMIIAYFLFIFFAVGMESMSGFGG